MELFGRRKIFTTEQITPENVIEEVNAALAIHAQNRAEEDYLHWYRRGKVPILNRVKQVRPEICAKVHIDLANPTVAFKNGYFLIEPAYYVAQREDEETVRKAKILNNYLDTSGKHTADSGVVDRFHTVGVGIMYVTPSKEGDMRSPYYAYSLDPRSAFCVYSYEPGNPAVMGVKMVLRGNNVLLDVFTPTAKYVLKGTTEPTTLNLSAEGVYALVSANEIVSIEENVVGEVPFVEYYYNENLMGAFENAISIANAVDETESLRQDGINQFIQSLVIAVDTDFEEGVTANTIQEAGMICLHSSDGNKPDLKILTQQLDQAQTQTTLDDHYTRYYEAVGVPYTTHEGGGTSDNVGAVYLRNGWANADTCAQNTEELFKQSNERFDRIVANILKAKLDLDIDPEDFKLSFRRNSTENLLAKTQAALNLKTIGLAPEIVLERSGLSNDPLNDVERSRKYIDAAFAIETPEKPTETTPTEQTETENA